MFTARKNVPERSAIVGLKQDIASPHIGYTYNLFSAKAIRTYSLSSCIFVPYLFHDTLHVAD
jgi:hypothetical protein